MKTLTYDQVAGRKEKAARFVRNVLYDDDRADEIEDESVEDYAERRKIAIQNPTVEIRLMPTKDDLQQRIDELEQENNDLQDQLDQIAQIAAPDDGDDDDDDDDSYDDDGDDVDDQGE